MKKIILFACAAIALASCGNKTASSEEVTDSTNVESVIPAEAQEITASIADAIKEAANDPTKLEEALTKAQEVYAQLVKDGKLEEAKKYASAVQAFISENAESIKSTANNATISSLVDGIKNLPTSAEATAEDAIAAVKADGKAIADEAKSTASEAANKAVDAAKTEAKNQANEAVNKAANKANEAASNAINNAAGKLLGK